jgi:ADP-heptose:LPS heptosyltransferase
MKRLVLFEFHLLGDAVMSFPFLRAAQTEYEVFVCCSPQAAKAYELALPPERIFRTDLPSLNPFKSSRPKSNEHQKACAAVRGLNATIGVTAWADVRVHLFMRSLGLPQRIGFPMNRRNYYGHHLAWRQRNLKIGQSIQVLANSLGMKLLTTAIERRDYWQHHVTDWAQLGESLGLAVDLHNPWLDPAAIKADLPDRALTFFAENSGRKIWLLHPGASCEWRRWPHFQELIETVLAPKNIPLVILQDPAARPLEPIYRNCLVWPMSSLADFTALAARCDYILCNDSAACHIGAALKKHVVTLFSSGSSAWFSPYSERTLIESTVCPYRPCLDRCQKPRYICLDEISLEKVAKPVGQLLS